MADRARECPLCGARVQRTIDGTPADGMRAHYLVVHPEQPVPVPGRPA